MYILERLWKGEEGQDLIEYALLLSLVAITAVAALPALGNTVRAVFNSAALKLN